MYTSQAARLWSCAIVLFWAWATLARGEDTAGAFEPVVRCVNIAARNIPGLAQSAQQAGLQASSGEGLDRTSVVLWEAKASADIDDAQAAKMGQYVRDGGNLILTLDQNPGKGVFRLRFMLPTTAWRTTTARTQEFVRSVDGADWDPAMFPPGAANRAPEGAPVIPYFYELRPFDTVERGQGRHEPLDQESIVLDGAKYGGDYKPWDPIFTRPLLNRDWQVRVRTDDLGASGLLITGRYGAGSVAVFASSARYMGEGMLSPLLAWMKQNQSTPASRPLPADQITSVVSTDVSGHALNIELTNHQAEAVKVVLIARVLTWENALVGDVERAVELPASGSTTVSIPLPRVDANSYQSLQFKDAYIVRSGVLSEDGREIVAEQRTAADMRLAASVNVMLDNTRAMPYPFKGPGYTGLVQFTERMGMPVMAYAYPPGAEVSGVVRVSNGLRNIAPLAKVEDQTQPDNPSIGAINDECANAGKQTRDDLHAFGWWLGREGTENDLMFTFPASVTVKEVILNGNPDSTRKNNLRNPGEVIVETDAGQAADVKSLDAAFQSQLGLVHVPLPLAKTQHVRVRFPWVAEMDGGGDRATPALGEIEIIGWQGDAPAATQGKLTVSVVDAMHQTRTSLAVQEVRLDPEQEQEIPIHFSAQKLGGDPKAALFYRVEASFAPEQSPAVIADAAPFMVIKPSDPLHSLDEIHPPGHVDIGFIVTRGFRNTSRIGTGTQETIGSWGSPDDLVWAYEHQLKQTPKASHSSANHLFTTELDFRHYAAPWSLFPNGEVFFDFATPNLVSLAKSMGSWKSTDTVALGFGDRWDTGPSGNNLYAWQEIVQFDEYLAEQGLPRLKGRTREELTAEISSKYDARWSSWQMQRYAKSVGTMRDAFAAAGKKLVISAQGLPLVPLKYLDDLAQTIMGFSDDSTWGMWGENIPVTTGREMALLAFNPDWKVSEVLVPGYDSAAISTRFWGVVGTTESTRRHFFDPGWRGLITSDGTYRRTATYGFNMNGESGYCMNLNDWQETWRLEERLSLLSPDGPLGAGIVVSNAAWDDPDHTTYSGGGMGDSEGDDNIREAAKGIGAFAQAGIPISFSSNWSALSKWQGTAPLILLGLTQLSPKEIEILASLHQRGVRMVAVSGEGQIPPAVAEVFGILDDGSPTTGKLVGSFHGDPVVATDQTLLIKGLYQNLDTADLRSILPTIKQVLSADLELPAGVGGYGFTMGQQRYVVLEDWREEPRTFAVRVKAKADEQGVMAVNVDDHSSLNVSRDGDDWVIQVPTRPGDGTLICIEGK
jgi:hypothetical protein